MRDVTAKATHPNKRHLTAQAYRGRKAVAFTACVEQRAPILADAELVSAFVPLLENAATDAKCIIPVYTFMPDHLHVLLLGTGDDSDAKAAMDRFKSRSGWWLYRHRPPAKWQTGYWDHVVRYFEGWEAQARYIAANPCRAGLAENVFDWPFTGSIGCDLAEVIAEAFW